MDISYVVTPFLAWLIAGCLKFAVNSLKARSAAFQLIGYGGFPSNHTSIVTSVSWLIAIREGVESPVLAVALALSFIVILDATSLRMNVGKHAARLNTLTSGEEPLRERIGHTPVEILGGVIVGFFTAFIVYSSARWLTLG